MSHDGGAQPVSQWFGSWRVDLSRSIYPGEPPFKKMTLRIEPRGNRVAVINDLIRPRGGVTHLEWLGEFDGRDFPVEGVEDVVTNAYRRVDDHTYEVIQKVDRIPVLTATMTLSPSGDTLTMKTANAVTVYRRE